MKSQRVKYSTGVIEDKYTLLRQFDPLLETGPNHQSHLASETDEESETDEVRACLMKSRNLMKSRSLMESQNLMNSQRYCSVKKAFVFHTALTAPSARQLRPRQVTLYLLSDTSRCT